MKKLLFLLLLAATSAGAQAGSDTSFRFVDNRVETVSLGAMPGATFYHGDCDPYETFTPWEVRSEGHAPQVLHSHEWVYAEREDINPSYGLTNDVYCPCGCSKTENQARICETCLRHEWRAREYGQMPKEKVKSKYLRLLESIKN